MEVRSYQEARVYLESLIKPFSSVDSLVGENVITPLEQMRVFLEKLGNPHRSFRSVVVSGTAGKGSSAYLLSHILAQGGYRIGLTISPHLQRLNERIQINGTVISDEALVRLVNQVVPVVLQMKETIYGEPSYHAVLAGMAFLYFSEQSIDLAVVEVGLEGKYEASNLLSAIGVILTNISLDHTDILGETVEEIAEEALSAITREGGVDFVVTGVKQKRVIEMVKRACEETGSELSFLSEEFFFSLIRSDLSGSVFDFSYGDVVFERLHLSMLGDFQVANASLVLAALVYLRRYGLLVSDVVVRSALKSAFYPGRFEQVLCVVAGTSHEVVLDGAHNEQKIQAFVHALSDLYPERRKIFVIAFKGVSRIKEMLQPILAVADVIVATEFQRPTHIKRYAALSQKVLFKQVVSFLDREVPVYSLVRSSEAFGKALSLAGSGDLVVVTGSLYLVGEIREFLNRGLL